MILKPLKSAVLKVLWTFIHKKDSKQKAKVFNSRYYISLQADKYKQIKGNCDYGFNW